MNKKSFLKQSNLYLVFCRNFGATDKRAGTFKDITSRLSEIKEFGFDVIWLMGIFELGEHTRSGTMGSPYSISNFTTQDHRLGFLDDLKDLIKEAHQLGLKIIIDAVFNHVSKDHLWIKFHPEYFLPPIPKLRLPQDKIANYEFMYNAQGKKKLATQVFSGKVSDIPFEDEFVQIGGDDLGGTWADTAQLNLANPKLRKELIAILKYWVELGVDGFRCDMAMLLLNDVIKVKLGKYAPYIHLPRKEFWREAIAEVKYYAQKIRGQETEIVFIGEAYRYLDQLFHCGFTSIYHHEFYNVLKEVVKGHRPVKDLYYKLFSFYQEQSVIEPLWTTYLMNHDEEASIKEFANNYLAALVLTVFLSGSFMVYNGEEVGNRISRQIDGTHYLMHNRDYPEDVPSFKIQHEELSLKQIYQKLFAIKKIMMNGTIEKFFIFPAKHEHTAMLGFAYQVRNKKEQLHSYAIYINFSINQTAHKEWATFSMPKELVFTNAGLAVDLWQPNISYEQAGNSMHICLKPGGFHLFELHASMA